MSTPLAASYRVSLPYTISGFPHVHRHYVGSDGTSVAGNYRILCRNGSLTVRVSDVVDAAWTGIGSQFDHTTITLGNALFEQLVSGVWIPLQAYTPTVTLSAAAAAVLGSEQTFTLRDSAFHKIRIQLMEGNIPPIYKQLTNVYGAINNHGMVDWLAGSSATPDADAPNTMVGRSNFYYTSFVSSVAGMNDRMRQKRGIR